MENEARQKGDILGRREIETLMRRFYASVRQDAVLGPVFDEVARVDWDEHIPKLCDFWETVLFRTGGYRGNPLGVHRVLAGQVAMDRGMFDRWLELFRETVEGNFAGENAGHIVRVAADMANVLHSRIQEGLPGAAPA